MAKKTYQKEKEKARPTRVDINYEVMKGTPVKRLPFRTGVMGNFSGHTKDLPDLSQREFVKIDKRNFDEVMEGMKPSLELNVKDTLSENEDDVFKVELNFKKWKDFHPSEIIKQVPRLKKLHDEREKLRAAKTALEQDGAIAKDVTELMAEILDNSNDAGDES